MEIALVSKDIVMAFLTLLAIIISFVALRYQIKKDSEKEMAKKADVKYVDREIDFVKRENEQQHISIVEINKHEHELTRQSLVNMKEAIEEFSSKMDRLFEDNKVFTKEAVETHELRHHNNTR